jgi:sugar O-acyltransferase (sialic acid O-acetyltransferase NeuD family)
MKQLAILGASGHGKVVAEIAEIDGWEVVFFDDAYPTLDHLEHWPVVGNTEVLLTMLPSFAGCFVAIGNNKIRMDKQKLLADAGGRFPILIHPSSIVSRYAQVGIGSVVMAGAVINSFTRIGQACIVNTASTIDHDCVLGDGVHISPGANLAGGIEIGETSWVGIGASVKELITIGRDVTIGAGAVVILEIPDGKTAIGVPAKIL